MDRDPGYAEAHGLLGFAYIFNTWTGWGDDPRSLIPKAEQAAQRALELDDNEPWAHLATSALYAYARRNDESIAEIEKVLALNPNLSFAYTWLGAILGYANKVDEANEALNRAYRISPLDPCNAWIPGLRSISTFTAGRYAEAAELALESLKLRPDMAGFFAPLHDLRGAYGKHKRGQTRLGRNEAPATDDLSRMGGEIRPVG